MEPVQGWPGFCFQLSPRRQCFRRSLTNGHASFSRLPRAHTHMINVATLPSLTFTAMQLRASLSYPAQSFIFLFFYSPILSPSVLFSRPLVRSHSFAHDPIFSRPGRLPLRGGSQARDPLLKQLLVELKRVPAHSPPPPHTHPHPLFSALRPLRCRSVLLSLIV